MDFLTNREDYAADQAALDELYSAILDLMTSGAYRLVDNTDFIMWAT